jgi:Domain of unknown function (DUF1833)
MPTTGTTAALARVRASAPAGVDIWETLTLEHSNWPVPYYLTNAPAAFTATLESGPAVTFQPFPFAVVLPTVDGAGQQDLQVTLTNADPAIADAVQRAHVDPTQRITATYRVFLSTLGSTQTPQSAPLRLSFDSIQITEEAVTGIAGRSDVLNRRFPGVWYDAKTFPGLDR